MTARHARSEAIARSCTCSSSHSAAVIALRCSGRLSVSWRTCRLGWSMSSAEPTRGSYALRRSAARQDRPRSRPCRAPTPPGSPSRASSSDAAVPPPWSARARRPCARVTLPPMRAKRPRMAVVGHIEWVHFATVPHVPRAGEVVHAGDAFEEPAGGGAVAAVQLARLGAETLLLTALGKDDFAGRAVARLGELGVRVRAAVRSEPTRRAVTLVDANGERTITTLGPRLQPLGEDAELPWSELAGM